jgi:hypothetical protein
MATKHELRRISKSTPALDHFENLIDVINAAAPGAATDLLESRPESRVVGESRVGFQIGVNGTTFQ